MLNIFNLLQVTPMSILEFVRCVLDVKHLPTHFSIAIVFFLVKPESFSSQKLETNSWAVDHALIPWIGMRNKAKRADAGTSGKKNLLNLEKVNRPRFFDWFASTWTFSLISSCFWLNNPFNLKKEKWTATARPVQTITQKYFENGNNWNIRI